MVFGKKNRRGENFSVEFEKSEGIILADNEVLQQRNCKEVSAILVGIF